MKPLPRLCLVLLGMALATSVLSQNLIQGGNMEDESAWNVHYFTDPPDPSCEFNYTTATPKFGRGGCLHVFQGEAFGQLLIWQRVTLTAGKTYRASAAIAQLDYAPGPSGGGAWYQLYIDPTDVDETAGDYNPGAIKFFNMDGWQPEFPVDAFDALWESASLGGGMPEAPYYTAPGTPGEEVEVTFGIKFGQWWSDYAGTTYELLVDELALFPVESAINAGGNMEDDTVWNLHQYNDPMEPTYEFNITDTLPKFGHGGCLHVVQGEAFGQGLLWQRLTLVGGETYRATGALACLDFNPGPSGGGAWYQMYIDPEEVVDGADYNPGAIKFFNLDGWQPDFPQGPFDDLWESVNLGGGVPSAPYYIAPGTPGEPVEVTFGIKFGQWYSDYAGVTFEMLVDDVYLFPMTEAGIPTAVEPEPVSPLTFALAQNYPNPFNPSTTLRYTLSQAGPVRLTVFDLLGHAVATLVDGAQAAGGHSIRFDASDLSSGVYFCKLEAGSRTATQKMMLMK